MPREVICFTGCYGEIFHCITSSKSTKKQNRSDGKFFVPNQKGADELSAKVLLFIHGLYDW